MLYLIGQIVFCLMFAALIGGAVGWLLRGLGTARQTDVVEARWRARVSQLEQQRAAALQTPAKTPVQPSVPAARASDNELEALRTRLAEREGELARLRTAQAVRAQPRVDEGLVDEMRETRELCRQLQGHLADQRTTNDQLRKQLERTHNDRETLVMRLRNTETEIGQLNKERQHAIGTIAKLQKELRDLRARRVAEAPVPGAPRAASEPAATSSPGAATGTGARADTQSAEPSSGTPPGGSLPPHTGAAAASGPQPATRAVGDTKPPPQPDLPIAAAPGSGPDESYEPGWRLRQPQGSRDNLQTIYGIGPTLERRLNELGIFHFRQIAAFRRDDILWVAQHLKAFPGRILRDRWVEQARSLAQRESGGGTA